MYGYARFSIFGWVVNNVVRLSQKQKRKRNTESFAHKRALRKEFLTSFSTNKTILLIFKYSTY